jgi:hypothetical protein
MSSRWAVTTAADSVRMMAAEMAAAAVAETFPLTLLVMMLASSSRSDEFLHIASESNRSISRQPATAWAYVRHARVGFGISHQPRSLDAPSAVTGAAAAPPRQRCFRQ